ncbi:MAG TPA: hypothetical protein VF175_14085 [Lacipirellula sp.]
MNEAEIRTIARRAMERRPQLVRLMRARLAVIVLGMMMAIALLARFTEWRLGSVFILVGAVSTSLVLAWNVVWVNTILFRITEDEIKHNAAHQE